MNDSDLINVDGMGVIYGAKFLNFEIEKQHKVSGIDLFFELIKLSEKKVTKFFIRWNRRVINITNKKLKIEYPNLSIVGFHNGYFWDKEETIVEKIKKSGAKILFVAITSPKKENFINKWKKVLNVNCVMGVGGTFDIVSGKAKRAPTWMQKNGFEWIFRIIQEPKRMWKRYLVTNSIYLYLLMKNKLLK